MRREVPVLTDELILATWYGRKVDPDTGEFDGGPIDHDYARRTLDEWEASLRLGRPKPNRRLRQLAAEAREREERAARKAEALPEGTPSRLVAEADWCEAVVATFRANERAGDGHYAMSDSEAVYAGYVDRAKELRRQAEELRQERKAAAKTLRRAA